MYDDGDAFLDSLRSMPTFERLPRFDEDRAGLSDEQKQRFRRAVAAFGLRVTRVQVAAGVWEITFAHHGTVRAGEPHVVWRRIGTHAVFTRP